MEQEFNLSSSDQSKAITLLQEAHLVLDKYEMSEDGEYNNEDVIDLHNRINTFLSSNLKNPTEKIINKLNTSDDVIRLPYPHTISDDEIKEMKEQGWEFVDYSFKQDQFGAWTYEFKRVK